LIYLYISSFLLLSSLLIPFSISIYRLDILMYIKQAELPGNPSPYAGAFHFCPDGRRPPILTGTDRTLPRCDRPALLLSDNARLFNRSGDSLTHPSFLRRWCVPFDGTVAPSSGLQGQGKGVCTPVSSRSAAGRANRFTPPSRRVVSRGFLPAPHFTPTQLTRRHSMRDKNT